jgi:hypothetical protein
MNTININGWIDCLILSMSTNVLFIIFVILLFIYIVLTMKSEFGEDGLPFISVGFLLAPFIILINSILPYFIYKNSSIIIIESFIDFMVVSFVSSSLTILIPIMFGALGDIRQKGVLGAFIGNNPEKNINLIKEILLILGISIIYFGLGALSIWLMYFKFGWAHLFI